MSIRPRPISSPERRFYASSVSPESAEVMARLGFGLLIVMQNEWPKAAEDVHRYREMVAERRAYAPTADHPDQRRLRANARGSPGVGLALSQREMGFHRCTTTISLTGIWLR